MANLQWGDTYLTDDGQHCKYFPVHEFQQKVLESTARFTAFIAGSGAGKTSLIGLWLAQQIAKKPKGTFGVYAPTYHILEDATIPRVREIFQGTALEGEYKQNKHTYWTSTGAKVMFISTDYEISIEGTVVDAAVIDEAGRVSHSAWDAINRRIGMRQAPVLITTTPYDFGWLYNKVYKPWQAGDTDYNVIQCSSIANPAYPREEYERKRNSMSATEFAQKHNGLFLRAEGLIYPTLGNCVIDDDSPEFTEVCNKFAGLPVEKKRLWGGWDFGIREPQCVVIGFLLDDVLYVAFTRYQRNKPPVDFASDLPKKGIRYFCDNNERSSIMMLRRLGYDCRAIKKGSNSIRHGISLVTERILTGRLKIVRSAADPLLKEADQYLFETAAHSEEEYIDKCVGADHSLDALRYLVMALNRNRSRPN